MQFIAREYYLHSLKVINFFLFYMTRYAYDFPPYSSNLLFTKCKEII